MTTATVTAPTARIATRGLHYNKIVTVRELHPRRSIGAIDSVTVSLPAERGKPCCRRVLSVGDLEPLAIPVDADGREYFNAIAEDYWVCVCGNTPGGAGHYTTYASGVEVDPGGDDWQRDGECYACADCGRIGAQIERDALGRVPVIGVAETLPTGEPIGESIAPDYTS